MYAILTTNSRIFVTAVFAVGIPVAFPGIVYAATVGFTFEFEFSALERALSFIASIATVIGSITNRHARCAVSIRALEHARPTSSRRAAR